MPPKTTDSASHGASHGKQHVPLSEALIAKIKAPTSGELRIYDSKVPGLLLRWRVGATKPRWYLLKRVRERTVQSVLGELSSWPEISVVNARALATEALAGLAKGISPSDVREKRRQDKADKEAQVVPLSEVWVLHEKSLEKKHRCAEHIQEMRLLCEQYCTHAVNPKTKGGTSDLRHPSIAVQAENWLDGLGLAPSTVRRRRGFFKSLGKTALKHWPSMNRNPFDVWELSTAGATPDIELFTMPECFALMSDQGMKHPWGPLGAALLYHGLRLKEGVWLHWDRIDPEAGVLRVTPPTADEWELGHRVKRNKSREVPLQSECLAIMEALPKQEDGYLFPESFRTVNRKTHWSNFRSWCKSVGIDPGSKHPHTLRHQRATLGLASNEGELRLQLSLGHAGADMTKHYAQQAMRLKKALGHWQGTMRFRDPVEIAKLSISANNSKEIEVAK